MWQPFLCTANQGATCALVAARRIGNGLDMKPYADTPGRFLRQFLGDVVVLGWIGAWVWLGVTARDWIGRLAAPGRTLAGAGGAFRDSMNAAGTSAHRVPLVGGPLRDALRSAGSLGGRLVAAGRAEQDTIGRIALGAMIVLIVLPAVTALALWLPGRVRWMRAAAAARRADPDLLALRALVGQSPRRIRAAAGEDPVGAWRRGDAGAIDRLAALHARSLGIRTCSGSH